MSIKIYLGHPLYMLIPNLGTTFGAAVVGLIISDMGGPSAPITPKQAAESVVAQS
jgi:hypothetical protein